MLAVAVVGLLVNIAAFAILHGGDRHNLNIRGAALHVLADLLGSVAAIPMRHFTTSGIARCSSPAAVRGSARRSPKASRRRAPKSPSPT
jgi:hypothetical protein